MTERPDPTPGSTTTVTARCVLVLAPHFDDEVLGCGGLLAQLGRSGATLRVLFLTDGSGGAIELVSDRSAYSKERQAEAACAAKALGVSGVSFLDLPDGRLRDARAAVAEAIRTELAAHKPDLLLVPSPLEATEDHRAAFAALHDAFHPLREGDPLLAETATLRVLAYEVNHPLYPNRLVDVGDALETIEQALACYPSQSARHPYREACLGLLRFRAHSLEPGTGAVEAYVELAVDDFRTRSLGSLVARFGGSLALTELREGPRVSVIVRTKDRPDLLAEALASLGGSQYTNAEVIVVNDGGRPPSLPEAFPLPLRLVDLERNRGRAAAANRGVAEAEGDAVTFLDDDDLALPEHLGTLAGLLAAAGVRVAYTDAAVGVYELDGVQGWACKERRLPYSRPFDPELLLYDNYIPLNTLIFERGLLVEAGPFDEDLPFFEDWDLLIRCAARARFHHLARVTCEYRLFRGADHHILGDTPRQRQDFLELKARVIAKHAGRANPATAARVVDGLRAEAVAADEERRNLRQAVAEADDRHHTTNGALENLRAEQRALLAEKRAVDARAAGLGTSLQAHQRDLVLRDEQLRATHAEIGRLGNLIAAMESTRAWRAHQWWQRLRGR